MMQPWDVGKEEDDVTSAPPPPISSSSPTTIIENPKPTLQQQQQHQEEESTTTPTTSSSPEQQTQNQNQNQHQNQNQNQNINSTKFWEEHEVFPCARAFDSARPWSLDSVRQFLFFENEFFFLKSKHETFQPDIPDYKQNDNPLGFRKFLLRRSIAKRAGTCSSIFLRWGVAIKNKVCRIEIQKRPEDGV